MPTRCRRDAGNYSCLGFGSSCSLSSCPQIDDPSIIYILTTCSSSTPRSTSNSQLNTRLTLLCVVIGCYHCDCSCFLLEATCATSFPHLPHNISLPATLRCLGPCLCWPLTLTLVRPNLDPLKSSATLAQFLRRYLPCSCSETRESIICIPRCNLLPHPSDAFDVETSFPSKRLLESSCWLLTTTFAILKDSVWIHCRRRLLASSPSNRRSSPRNVDAPSWPTATAGNDPRTIRKTNGPWTI